MQLTRIAVALVSTTMIAACDGESADDVLDELGVAVQAIEPVCPVAPSQPPSPNSGTYTTLADDGHVVVTIDPEVVSGYQDGCDSAYETGDFWTHEWRNARAAFVMLPYPTQITDPDDCEESTIRASFYHWNSLGGWYKAATLEDSGVWNGTACLEPRIDYIPSNTTLRLRVRAHAVTSDEGDWETVRTAFAGYGPDAPFPF